MTTAIFGFVFLISNAAFAADPPLMFNFSGKLFQSNGVDPVENASVTFKTQILSPDGTCLLFEQTDFRDMTSTGGVFSLMVGTGTVSNASALSIPQVFDNLSPKTGAANCNYTPASGDSRRIRFSYNDGSSTILLPTDQWVASVPYALTAQSLGGLGKDGFIQVSSNITQTNLESLTQNVSAILNVASGTSTTYAKSSDLPVTNGVLDLSSRGVEVPNVPPAAIFAVNKNYSDANIAGRAVDVSTLANGQALVWNSTLNKWQANTLAMGTVTSITAGSGLTGGTINGSGTIALNSVGTAGTYSKVTTDSSGRVVSGSSLQQSDMTTALGYTPLNKAGDTLSGDLNLAGHNLINTGYLTLGSGKYLSLGSFDTTTEGALITSTLSPGGMTYAGVEWFNTATKTIKYWDGTQPQILTSSVSGGALQSFNGQTAATQTIGFGSTGLLPNVTSLNGVHTFNFPMASGAGITAGLISNSDYAIFSSKQASLGYTPIDRSGSNSMAANLNMSPDNGTTTFKITNLRDPTAAQDAATKNYADQTVAGNKSSIGILNNSTDINKIAQWTGTTTGWMMTIPTNGTVTNVTASAPLSVNTSSTTPQLFLQAAAMSGQSLSWNGSAWVSGFANTSQLRSATGTNQFPTNCTASQTLVYSSVSDTFQCTNITVAAATGIATPGTYRSVVVDTTGRVTSGTNPTTLAGYGITDVVPVLTGVDSAKPTASINGRIYVAADSKIIYLDNGSLWIPVASNGSVGSSFSSLTGDVSASGTGAASAVVNSVGGSTALNVHSAEVLANASTNSNTASTIVKRDGSGNFAANSLNLSSVVLKDSSTNSLTLQSPTTYSTYALTFPAAAPSSNNQILSSTTAGVLSWTSPYADTNARAAISASSPLSYNSTTGALSISTLSSLTGDVTASGTGAVSSVVNSVGGSTASNLHAAEVLANASTNTNTASTIVKRDGSGNFAANNINLSSVVLKDSSTNSLTLQSPTTYSSYALTFPAAAPSSNNQILSSTTAGVLSWTSPYADSNARAAISASAPLSYNSTTGAVSISNLPVANGGTNSTAALNNNSLMISSGGAIVEASALTHGQILIGSTGAAPTAATLTAGSGIAITNAAGSITIAANAALGSASGDLSGTFPSPTVAKIQGVAVSSTSPTSGRFMEYNGTNWIDKSVNITDLKSSIAGNLFSSPNCSAAQTLSWSAISDQFSCVTIAITDSNVTFGTKAANTILAAPSGSSGTPTFRALAATDLPSGVVTAGTYNTVSVDTYGRVTAGTNPTTLSGHGITDAVQNAGGIPSLTSGLDAAKGSATTAGRLYVATDTLKIYRDTGSSWTVVSSANGSGGTLTSLTAGAGLTGGTVTATGTLAVDSGTTANKIVVLDANAKLPAVDGSQLTNLPQPTMATYTNVYSTDATSTWTVPAGVTRVYVQVWGAGGGGGGGNALGMGGSGGGGGGYGAAFLTVTPGAAMAATVGTAGTGAAAAAAGGAGGSSIFSTITATGGAGEIGSGQAPIAGGTSSATINVAGGRGSSGASGSSGGTGGAAGGGGGSGGGGSSSNTIAGGAGSTPGGGGGGGGGAASGAGGSGRVTIWY